MYIERNQETLSFINKCRHNLSRVDKNIFLDLKVTPKNEMAIKRKLQKAGFAEFKDLANAPGLFISTSQWLNSPFHSNIVFPQASYYPFSYEKVHILGNRLFNADVIQKDPLRQLNDYLKLRAMDSDFETIYLYQNKKAWMLDAPSESLTNDPYASKAKGRVLTFGLGIGYFLYMALINPNVQEVTVVEKAPELIAMFKKVLFPQFPQNKKVNFICGDAYKLFNASFCQKYDYIYVDIWQSNNDGLIAIERLLKNYFPPLEKVDFWLEDSCQQIIWHLIFHYFCAIFENKEVKVAKQYRYLMRKIENYFASCDVVITRPQQWQFFMYDCLTCRKILANKSF